MENKEILLKEEDIVEKIKDLVNKINTTSNPDELEKLKNLIRKNVPFSRRSYFTAMLLKMVLSEKTRIKPRDENKNNKTSGEEKKEHSVPNGFVTIYINIGKMKNVYSQDISSFIQQELNIKKEDISLIRVHDKYSFVTLSEENSKKAIEILNGKTLKGRTLSVSLAR